MTTDGPLLSGRTVTIEAVAHADDDFGEEFGIELELPHDVEVLRQDALDLRPIKAQESRTRRTTIRVPADDIERRVVVSAGGIATAYAGDWDSRETLTISEDGVPMDFEASARLRPGATVDLVVRAVEVSEPYLVTLFLELPPDVQVVSGTTRKGPIAVRGKTRVEELRVRVTLPNDGQRRKLRGWAGWESPSPDSPTGRRPVDFMPMVLETEGP